MAKWDINFEYRVDMDQEIINYSIKAEAHRQITAKIPLPPSLADEIDKLNIIRQIKGTTGLEGNPLSESEVRSIIEQVETGNKSKQKSQTPEETAYDIEVKNAYEVQRFIRKLVSENNTPVITEDLIKQIHYLSTKNIDSDINIPGEYRRASVRAGDYSPPNPGEIQSLMTRFIEMANHPSLVNSFPLIRAIVVHFYLITIHPFGDGNGRTSRAIEAYVLYHSKFNARGFYSLANYFYRNRESYVKELQEARFTHNANLTSFVKFALKGFVEEISIVQEEILNFVRKIVFLSYVNELHQTGKINSRCLTILDILTRFNEKLSIKNLKDRTHPLIKGLYENIKTNKTITRDFDSMKQIGLIVIDENGLIKANVELMNMFEG